MRFFRILSTIALLVGAVPTVRAHVVETAEFQFEPLEKEWVLSGEMDIAFMLPEIRGVAGEPPLSRAKTLQASPQELARMRTETENTLKKLLKLSFAGKEVPWTITFPDFEKQPFDLPPDRGDIALLSVRLSTPAIDATGELSAHWNDDLGSELIVVSPGWGDSVLTASPGRSTVLLRVEKAAEADAPAKVTVPDKTLIDWIRDGYEHVVPLGFDHLMFILGLFFLRPQWKPLMVQSLLFTAAHSITLALAVLGWVSAPGKPVEILIAASIAWIGIENLLGGKVGKGRLALVFCFGLIHGLGFASMLGEKLTGIPKEKTLLPLVGFNVGVELAQISVLAAAFLILWPLKKWTKQIQIAGSIIVAWEGLKWVVERIIGA